ncbi:hypothetical protein LCGC14_0412230 [marine sediment metagenome]|uniref:Uncharacterized protein n=1 Tax=marine sediment metagenome TaxID=412755 RepID=A0A0F9TBG3_9ZZZZ
MEWIWGALIPVGAAGLVALIATFTKRAKLYERAYRWGTWLRRIGLGYDLPIIGGDQEMKIKETLFSSVSDILRGLARALAGQSLK